MSGKWDNMYPILFTRSNIVLGGGGGINHFYDMMVSHKVTGREGGTGEKH